MNTEYLPFLKLLHYPFNELCMDVVSSDAKTLVNLLDGITQSQSGIKNQLWEEIPM